MVSITKQGYRSLDSDFSFFRGECFGMRGWQATKKKTEVTKVDTAVPKGSKQSSASFSNPEKDCYHSIPTSREGSQGVPTANLVPGSQAHSTSQWQI
jgi:hypothetical protein